MKWLILVSLLCWSNCAIAYDGGICKSRDIFYRNMEFKVEETTDLTYAVEFAKVHHGQLVTEQGREFYSVIYNDGITAPATQYDCSHIESGD